MSVVLYCSEGHQWQSDSKTLPPGTDPLVSCPVCGKTVKLSEAHSESSTKPPSSSASDEIDQTLPPPPENFNRVPSLPTVEIPGYEVERELGRGGMGVVYRARHVQLNRIVALKMILAGGHAGADELARFYTEARAVAQLQHPNIIEIHDIGDDAGKPYCALEFCPGGALDGQLDGTPWDGQRAAKLVETLANAMHVAHQAQIIHRDLKPANILLTADGQPKITDFGLAKKLDEAGQTQSGAIMGTPSYMAPEQAEGKAEKLGPHTDVYALGAILYELLTGRPPFKSTTAMDTIMQVVAGDLVPPSRLQPKAPRDLETICLTALQRDPSKRYPSALELAKDLRRFQNLEPIQAQPPTMFDLWWKWVRRRPGVAILSTLLLLLVLIAIPVLYSYWQIEKNDNELLRMRIKQLESTQPK